MKCVIFASMPTNALMRSYCDGAEIIIAADMGWMHARRLGVEPTLCVGDYDSAEMPQFANVELLPREKDDTDTMYAARRAVKLGADEVILLGALGGRIDHTLANFAVLLYLENHGVKAMAADETTQITVLKKGKHVLNSQPDTYVSLFPVGKKALGITLDGFKYPLKKATIKASFPIGISNEFKAETGEITVKHGALYCILTKKEHPAYNM
ncbi:MAG: thiamine diphosphokinase [Clostridia bacterium]|nr:thiamine diphosphokinase [Clostridia bacterium]NLS86092.1 thiamine diphosphokinase [Oscillospiraceae bacterium]